MIFIRKNSKGHNSVKMQVECRSMFPAHRLIMIYICTKFHENTLNGSKVMERIRKVNGQTDRQTDGGHDIIRPVFGGRIKTIQHSKTMIICWLVCFFCHLTSKKMSKTAKDKFVHKIDIFLSGSSFSNGITKQRGNELNSRSS